MRTTCIEYTCYMAQCLQLCVQSRGCAHCCLAFGGQHILEIVHHGTLGSTFSLTYEMFGQSRCVRVTPSLRSAPADLFRCCLVYEVMQLGYCYTYLLTSVVAVAGILKVTSARDPTHIFSASMRVGRIWRDLGQATGSFGHGRHVKDIFDIYIYIYVYRGVILAIGRLWDVGACPRDPSSVPLRNGVL